MSQSGTPNGSLRVGQLVVDIKWNRDGCVLATRMMLGLPRFAPSG